MSEIERAIEIRDAIDFCRYLESGQTDEVEVHYIPAGTILPILESELLRELGCKYCKTKECGTCSCNRLCKGKIKNGECVDTDYSYESDYFCKFCGRDMTNGNPNYYTNEPRECNTCKRWGDCHECSRTHEDLYEQKEEIK